MNSNKLMLIDGNSILNRAFYGLQGSNLLATAEGLYTNAVYGFVNIMYKYLEEEKPDFLCVAFYSCWKATYILVLRSQECFGHSRHLKL